MKTQKGDEGGARTAAPTDFIREAVKEDLRTGSSTSVHTRFPPEPNAYLHIGHAKAVWIDYGIAQDFGGLFNLRFDDTNPTKEEQEFVDAIIEDVRWLGADWDDRLFFASDYFEQMYEWALDLIKQGQGLCLRPLRRRGHRDMRGTPTDAGQGQPLSQPLASRRTSISSRACARGEFPDGSRTLRAKIDMASPNSEPARPGDVPHPARRAPPHRATSGASTRCTTGRTAWRTPSRASRTRSARWSTRTTARSTTGSWTSSASTTRARSSSRGST